MSIQTRTTALQNEIVRLYFNFEYDGKLQNPASQPLVEILDTDGANVLAQLPASVESTGVYYVDWYVPATLPLGDYYDRWTYQWSITGNVQEHTNVFSVYGLDSYINFVSPAIAHSISERAAQLMIQLSNDFIYEAMHIPVYWEQAMRIQQEDQQKRVKDYYYFYLTDDSFYAEEGATYFNNGHRFTVVESHYPEYSSSSSSSESIGNSSSSSSSLAMSSSSSSSLSSSSSSLDSSSSTSLDSSSSSSGSNVTTTTTTQWSYQSVLTTVGTGNPFSSGTLAKISGTGSSSITFSSYQVKRSRFSTKYNLAYQNWNRDPRPIVRVNNTIQSDGWTTDWNGNIYFDGLLMPEDSINVRYQFAYFSDEEILSFLQLGLDMMNSMPPASSTYTSLTNMPREWNAPVLLWAAITALRRLIFGLNWQEKRIIFTPPDRPDQGQAAIDNFKSLLSEYLNVWKEQAENAKTKKLPAIALSITPEYTLPGGRCMSSDTYIRFMVDGKENYLTIKDAYNVSLQKDIKVESVNNGKISFERVLRIWKSGNKKTYWVKTQSESIRLTEEHLVYLSSYNKFTNVGSLKKNDIVLVNNNGKLIEAKLINDPIVYGFEEVYDIEVPSTENFIGNNIVSHNSRFFRYLYKSS